MPESLKGRKGYAMGVEIGQIFPDRESLRRSGVHVSDLAIHEHYSDVYSVLVDDLGEKDFITESLVQTSFADAHQVVVDEFSLDATLLEGVEALHMYEGTDWPFRLIQKLPSGPYVYRGMYAVAEAWDEIDDQGRQVPTFALVDVNSMVDDRGVELVGEFEADGLHAFPEYTSEQIWLKEAEAQGLRQPPIAPLPGLASPVSTPSPPPTVVPSAMPSPMPPDAVPRAMPPAMPPPGVPNAMPPAVPTPVGALATPPPPPPNSNFNSRYGNHEEDWVVELVATERFLTYWRVEREDCSLGRAVAVLSALAASGGRLPLVEVCRVTSMEWSDVNSHILAMQRTLEHEVIGSLITTSESVFLDAQLIRSKFDCRVLKT